jgi:hypothetical protein
MLFGKWFYPRNFERLHYVYERLTLQYSVLCDEFVLVVRKRFYYGIFRGRKKTGKLLQCNALAFE